MSKFKYDIANKNLSWEKLHTKTCDNIDCKNIGEYKAPKSRSELNKYYFFLP